MKHMSAALLLAAVVAAPLFAQETPQAPKPLKEHDWLKQFVGDWESESEAMIGPDQKMKCKGTMKAKMLGGFWMISETKGDMMGVTVDAIQTIGYDPEKKKYVGSWVDSMMNHMWKYEGSVDETGKILTLEAEGPSFTQPGETAKYRDVYEFKGKDQIAVSSSVQTEDGEWTTFMTGTAKRKKK
jgi:hypothetical protein